jgi:hypothetical protein
MASEDSIDPIAELESRFQQIQTICDKDKIERDILIQIIIRIWPDIKIRKRLVDGYITLDVLFEHWKESFLTFVLNDAVQSCLVTKLPNVVNKDNELVPPGKSLNEKSEVILACITETDEFYSKYTLVHELMLTANERYSSQGLEAKCGFNFRLSKPTYIFVGEFKKIGQFTFTIGVDDNILFSCSDSKKPFGIHIQPNEKHKWNQIPQKVPGNPFVEFTVCAHMKDGEQKIKELIFNSIERAITFC